MKNTQIDPTKYYSASKLIAMKVLPWKSTMTFTGILNTPSGQDVFKPMIRHATKNKRYILKGSVVLEFLKEKKGVFNF